MVASQMITNMVHINIVTDHADPEFREVIRSELNRWTRRISAGGTSYTYQWKIRKPLEDEERVFIESKTWMEVDHRLDQLKSHRIEGHVWIYMFFEPNEDGPYKFINNTVSPLNWRKPILGFKRFAYMLANRPNLDDDDSRDSTMDMILETIDHLTFDPKKNNGGGGVDKGNKKMVSSDPMKYLLSQEMDVIINLIHEDIEDAIEMDPMIVARMKSMISKMYMEESGIITSNLFTSSSLHISIQKVYHAIDAQFINRHLMNKDLNTSEEERLFPIESAPQLLNAIETRIVEHNNKQSYHINVIVPRMSSDHQNNEKKMKRTLEFYDMKRRTKSNSIISPYRGSVLIWNNEDDFTIGFKVFMRALIGLPYESASNDEQSRPYYDVKQLTDISSSGSSVDPIMHDSYIHSTFFYSKWELDSILRHITLNQIQSTLSSLESIEKLLQKVSNIVINEEVSQRIHDAYNLSMSSIGHLQRGDLPLAHSHSCQAYKYSESAFFDPSLLSLLYFPDDQKYAVYFPLFLPVSLPLFSSLYHLLKTVTKK